MTVMSRSCAASVADTIRSWHHGRIPATRTERGRELFTRLAPRLLEALARSGAPDEAFRRFAVFFSGLAAGVQVQALFLNQPKLFEMVLGVMAFAPRLARTLGRQPAALDGVPRWFVFWRITLPMLTPFLLTATLFRVIESIQQFDIIYAMTQGGPGDTLTVFQVEAYLNFFQSTNVGRSAALLMILWAITYVLSNIFIKNWLRLREKQRGNA